MISTSFVKSKSESIIDAEELEEEDAAGVNDFVEEDFWRSTEGIISFSSLSRFANKSSTSNSRKEGIAILFLKARAMGEAVYSFSLTTFSPSGKLLQIEHALKAVQAGKTSLGIQATNGVVIATEKKLPSVLVDEASVEKIQLFTENIGVVYSGMGPDFRVLVQKGQKKAATYKLQYGESIPVLELVREIAAIAQDYTQSGGVRPFGISILVAGVDHNGPQLYQVDPSGSYFGWRASAIGKNFANAKTFLEKRYEETIELEDAIHTALLTLREGFEGEMTSSNIEVGIVGMNGNFRILTAEEVQEYLAEAA